MNRLYVNLKAKSGDKYMALTQAILSVDMTERLKISGIRERPFYKELPVFLYGYFEYPVTALNRKNCLEEMFLDIKRHVERGYYVLMEGEHGGASVIYGYDKEKVLYIRERSAEDGIGIVSCKEPFYEMALKSGCIQKDAESSQVCVHLMKENAYIDVKGNIFYYFRRFWNSFRKS